MNLEIKNKVALIGGGSKGLGKACALRLAEEGVNIILCSRGKEDLLRTANEIKSNFSVKVLPIASDLSDIENIKSSIIDKALSEFSSIDILFINSGGPKAGDFFSLEESDWRFSFDSVFYYVVELYKHIIPIMKKNKWGRIINNTSLTVKEPPETLILSNVYRTAIVSLAKSISKSLIKDNITINNICPGAFKTDRAFELMKERSIRTNESLKDIEREIVKNIPLGRYQHPKEYADLFAYLCSNNAVSLTGNTIQIDGGLAKGIF